MQKPLLGILTLALALTAHAGPLDVFRGDAVKLEHMVGLSPEGLDSLKDSEHAVLVAQVALERAKLAASRAEDDVKAAKRAMDTDQLDVKAARAEEKAARANKDDNRLAVARLQTAAAEEKLQVAKAHVDWKEQIEKAYKEEVDRAKAALDLTEAQRDVARVRKLVQENVPEAGNYSVGEFENRVRKRQKDLDNAARKVERQWTKAEQLEQAYERLAAKRSGEVG